MLFHNNFDRKMDMDFPDSKPYGKTLGEWAEEWIKWALSIPKKRNPAYDSSGEYSNTNQSGPVFYLAGTFGGFVKRQCSIPSGKSIFFPVIEKECSFVEDQDLHNEHDLHNRARQFIDCVTHLEFSLDGVSWPDLKKYRVHSEVFDLIFPSDNVYDVVPGSTRSVTDGYWMFLRPLTIGKHEIFFSGEASLPENSKLVELARHYNKIKGTVFTTGVNYNIQVI
jgi:hypothetical protein